MNYWLMQTCLLIELFLAVFANLPAQPPFYKYILLISSSSCRLPLLALRECGIVSVAVVIVTTVESLRLKTV